jgi:hypothetical protein
MLESKRFMLESERFMLESKRFMLESERYFLYIHPKNELMFIFLKTFDKTFHVHVFCKIEFLF